MIQHKELPRNTYYSHPPFEVIPELEWDTNAGILKDGRFTTPYSSTVGENEITYTNGPGNYYVRTRFRNSCGWSPWITRSFTVNSSACFGSFSLMAFPNPATDSFEIEVENSLDKTAQPEPYTLTIHSDRGKKMFGKKSDKKKEKIETRDWKKGTYYIRVKYNKFNLERKIVVKKQ
jgi:hypothetical protein